MFFLRATITKLSSAVVSRNFSRTVLLCKFKQKENSITDTRVEEILNSDDEYNEITETALNIGDSHRTLIIQPYVKWGPQKLTISPEEQLEEAVALVKTLPDWSVVDTVKVPLDTLQRKPLFKSGTMDRIQEIIQRNNTISAVFINVGNLRKITSEILQKNFHLPILDRYRIVMQILKAHATSKHAKLQVALAELYYIQSKAEKDLMFKTMDSEDLKLMFQTREQKIKLAISELRNQREMLRTRRRKMEYPIVAVVGYTNAGKTSVIKALTGEEGLQPKNQLFATLDVTMHAGRLPSGLEVLFVDTVGFISDIPTSLIECFIATLEDAVLADVILHVEDLSSSTYEFKKNFVLKTLKELGSQMGQENILEKVVSVGNKCDIANKSIEVNVPQVSTKSGTGLDGLRYTLEEIVLRATSRKVITIKVPNGGDEIRWLFKNSTVLGQEPDENNPQLIKAQVIITKSNLEIFKHRFI